MKIEIIYAASKKIAKQIAKEAYGEAKLLGRSKETDFYWFEVKNPFRDEIHG